MPPPDPSRPGRIATALRRIEDALLVTSLAAMIVIACTQILLRNLDDQSIAWGDPTLRILVLWVGMIGAMVAARDNRHIRIDLLSRFLPPMARGVGIRITSLFTAGVCGLLAFHAGRFVHMDWQSGFALFAGIPAWVTELILPLGFALISVRYLLLAVGVISQDDAP